MSRARLILLGVASVLAVVALTAPAASAKISFEWFVGGSLLAKGEERTFDYNTDGHTFDFHTAIAGLEVLLLSTNVSVEDGLLFGGRPGDSREAIIFRSVTVAKPVNCVVAIPHLLNPVLGKIDSGPMNDEIVEGENGEVLILITPEVGSSFIEVLFLDKSATETCPLKNVIVNIEGNVLALPSSQKKELLRQDLVFPSVENNFFLSSGTLDKAALLYLGQPVTLQGLTLALLASDAVWGPF